MIRILHITLMICLFQLASYAQQKNDAIKTALLIIDVQNFYFPGENPGLENAEHASLKAKEILQLFRKKEELIIHVRHKAKQGFDIHKNVEPLASEKVITKEEVNSFYKTDLLAYLHEHRINRLVIIGMQTHMCLEAAVRSAHDFGFECVVVQDACATRDVTFGDKIIEAEVIHNSTLATLKYGGYAKVIDALEFAKKSEKYLYEFLD